MNTLKSDHLKPGEKAIQVCFDYVKISILQEVLYWLGFNRGVDYYSGMFRNKIMGNINPEEDSYVISQINGTNKISRGYYDCTGLVIIGKDKEGKNISFLTHQNPRYLFCRQNSYDKLIRFKNDLQSKIEELKQKCIPGTIDAFIVGGNYIIGEIEDDNEKINMKVNYCKSVELLRAMVFKDLGFHPCVAGPILDSGFSDIMVDTKNRRVLQKRRRKEDFILLDNTLFQADKLEENIPELDEKCKNKKVSFWEVFT